MAVLPQGGIVLQDEMEEEQMPSRTYRLDLEKKRIVGHVDGLESVKQAAFLILQTERFEHLIYGFSYGFEGRCLIGQDRLYFQSEIKRRIREALLQDDRIIEIEEFQISINGDSALIQFTVVSDYGTFEMEVAQNV